MVKNEDKINAIKEIESRDGVCTPEALVEYATPVDSPIHDLFVWDDSYAAEQYRIWQARGVIKKIKVMFRGHEVQAYKSVKVSVKIKGDGEEMKQGYVNIQRIYLDKSLHNQVLVDAIQRLRYWQVEYKNLKELENVINEEELEKVEKTIKQR